MLVSYESKGHLRLTKHDTRMVAKYLQLIKGITNELPLANILINKDDLIPHTLGGLGLKFKEENPTLS